MCWCFIYYCCDCSYFSLERYFLRPVVIPWWNRGTAPLARTQTALDWMQGNIQGFYVGIKFIRIPTETKRCRLSLRAHIMTSSTTRPQTVELWVQIITEKYLGNCLRRQRPHFITDSPTILQHENARCYEVISAKDPSGMTEMIPGVEGTPTTQAVSQFREAGGSVHHWYQQDTHSLTHSQALQPMHGLSRLKKPPPIISVSDPGPPVPDSQLLCILPGSNPQTLPGSDGTG